MSTDDGLSTARDVGRAIAEEIAQRIRQPSGVSVRRATVKQVRTVSGALVADLTVPGATMTSIPIVVSCAGMQPGNRVLLLTVANHSYVVGVIAAAGSTSPLLSWSNTWSGAPATADGVTYSEGKVTVHHGGGVLLCEVAAAISGTGEYGMAFDFVDSSGKTVAHWGATSPQKNGGTLRWVASGTVNLPAGDYQVELTTCKWGTVSIVGTDSSGNSRKWRDANWGTDGVPRYARITRI